MVEYRYHRMANNVLGWRRPHSGRLGLGKDYVGENGFGHEDWNFAKDIWQDGNYHLYLRQSPNRNDIGATFNIVLGVHTPLGAMIVGFAENATYGASSLDNKIWLRRARDIQEVEEAGGIGGYLFGVSFEEKAKILQNDAGIYSLFVHPNNLLVLEQPTLVPTDIFQVSTPMYRLLKMTNDEYASVKEYVHSLQTVGLAEDSEFPEGLLIERQHKVRERDQRAVRLAKENFIKTRGSLYCEACGMKPENYFSLPELSGKIIEAHHDVPLSSPDHPGRTRSSDIRMLCPNCHRAIHSIRPWKKVDELKLFFQAD